MTATDITQQTPAEIDHQISEVVLRATPHLMRANDSRRSAKRYAKYAGYQRQVERCQTEAAKYQAKADEILTETAPFDAEYERRGGWSRFFLCQSDGGHIHRRSCSTLRPTTMVSWLPHLSGASEEQAVEQYGNKMCTVCFPSAPTHPAWMKSVEEREAAEAAKAATLCPGSGQQALNSDFRYYTPRGECPHCHAAITPTSTGKVRKHKPRKES